MTTYKRLYLLTYALPAACVLAPSVVEALDWGVTPRISTGALSYEIEQLSGESANSLTLTNVMPFVEGGVTMSADRFFLDLSVQGAFSGDDSEEDSFVGETEFRDLETGNVVSTETDDFNTNISADWDRQEYSLAGGLQVTNNITIFVGYKLAKTDFDSASSQSTFVDTDITDVTTGSGLEDTETITRDYSMDFEQEGPFFGVAFGTPLGGDAPWAGFLSFRTAFAFLDAEFKQSGTEGTPQAGRRVLPDGTPEEFAVIPRQPFSNSVEGSTLGINVGLSWQSDVPVVKGLGYTVSFEGYRYEYTLDGPFSLAGGDPEFDTSYLGTEFFFVRPRPDIVETVLRFGVGLTYAF